MPTLVDLSSGNNTATNPPTTMSMTTTAALADGESVFVGVEIPNDNPTFAASGVTFAGHNMTEVVRMAKTGTGAAVLFGYKNATGSSIASGATVTATWTNTGTQLGGGAGINAGKCDTVVDPTVADTTGSGQATNTTPTATSGTPSSSTKNYLVVSLLAGLSSINAAGQATPPAGYTAFSEGFAGTPRFKSIYAGGVVRTAPVSAETAAWSQTWGASKQWTEIVALFELAAAGLTVTAPPASLTLSAPTPAASESAAAPPGSLTLSAPAPTAAESVQTTAARADLSASSPRPAFVVNAAPASITLGAGAPSLAGTLTATPATLTLSAPSPTLPVPLIIAAPPATLTLSAAAPAFSSFTLPNVAAVRYFTAPRAHLRTLLSPVAETDALVSPAVTLRAD